MSDPAGRGYIYILRPTPELWTLALPHRTQLVYTPDTAFILAKLCVRPGTICLEAGTGSGSFTHALARQVAPHGKVYTHEFHEKRHELNVVDFTAHGLDDLVISQHRDVCADGFNGEPNSADCAFLDLPSPWDAIPHLPSAFTRKRITRVCCFSPCIEQVLSTHTALRKYGFTNITTYDLKSRNYMAQPIVRKSVEDACTRLASIRQRIKQGLPKEPKEDQRKKRKPEEGDGLNWMVVGKGDYEIQTHTSFLTFGELMPIVEDVEAKEIAAQEQEEKAA